MIKIQESGGWVIPIDHYTDCRDLFELLVGEKGVPQDRYQRVYVMPLREDRLKQAITRLSPQPEVTMVAMYSSLVTPASPEPAAAGAGTETKPDFDEALLANLVTVFTVTGTAVLLLPPDALATCSTVSRFHALALVRDLVMLVDCIRF